MKTYHLWKRIVALGVLALLVTFGWSYTPQAQTALNNAFGWAATGKLVLSDTAPTISSAFGTSPSISASNGASAFIVNVGGGGSATAGVIAMPTASTGWICAVNDITAAAAHVAYNTRQTASAAATVTIENQTTSTGAAVAWGANDLVRLACTAY